MRKEILIFDIVPVPAPRPRVTKSGAYMPESYRNFKRIIGYLARRQLKAPFTGAVKMNILFQFKKPKSWSKAKRKRAFWHTQKPDKDNLEKSIKDALEGIAYRNDSAVASGSIHKVWGDCNRIVVELEDLSDEERPEMFYQYAKEEGR
ncbi:RusA family crossover junction endodeoxyribonuclease [Nitratifractor salsuginis]|uniref:Endodeoxyribonuclease RusA n=1 Tax=Nitratifractor salsuginis (strain DSM 16511 / JCM 12458 / E9I37-1) TaxID=749222 RepID=E6WYD1_NITSE|nr:RusA family crossover junction endodeoxyribonuclease [Nitratifractor salsuginis]ADV46443.1 endodeoxyribonuclease RusA [Nitratifractor salsuginis DSM 16511]